MSRSGRPATRTWSRSRGTARASGPTADPAGRAMSDPFGCRTTSRSLSGVQRTSSSHRSSPPCRIVRLAFPCASRSTTSPSTSAAMQRLSGLKAGQDAGAASSVTRWILPVRRSTISNPLRWQTSELPSRVTSRISCVPSADRCCVRRRVDVGLGEEDGRASVDRQDVRRPAVLSLLAVPTSVRTTTIAPRPGLVDSGPESRSTFGGCTVGRSGDRARRPSDRTSSSDDRRGHERHDRRSRRPGGSCGGRSTPDRSSSRCMRGAGRASSATSCRAARTWSSTSVLIARLP